MSLRAALADALLIALATPATWPLGLATFLLRGGLVVVAVPILVLPTPVGLGNLLAPTLMQVAFQGVSPAIAALVALLVAALMGWLVVGGLIAAMLEAEAARIVAREAAGGLEAGPVAAAPPRSAAIRAARILAVRVIAHVPTAVAFSWGSARLAAIAYRELTSPFDVSIPIVLRVLRQAPEVIGIIVVLWVAGEIVGALAAGRLVAGEPRVGQALVTALRMAARRAATTVGAFTVPTLALAFVLVPAALAAGAAWSAVRLALQPRVEPVWGFLAVGLLVSVWIVGLALLAVIAAWRAAVWTLLTGGVTGSADRHGGSRG